MPDQQLTCAGCGRPFVWTDGEQRFYRERRLDPPRRCPACRAARRGQPPPATQPPGAPAPRRRPARRPLARPATPRGRFGLAALAATLLLSAGLLLAAPAAPLLAWALAVNGVALLAFGYDKGAAGGGGPRVPEAVLLGLALAGGSPGALLGMLLFRHKTSKGAFLAPFWLIVALQLALGLGWLLIGAQA